MINDVKLSKNNTLSFTQLLECLKTACLMLNPCIQIKNPVMFVTYIGSIVTTLYTLEESFTKTLDLFHLQIAIWLWFTVLFANFAQSLAESKGKAQAASLRKSQVETFTKKIIEGKETTVSTSELKKGDVILCYTNDIIPADGEVIQGVATVDESAITGESAPVIRESGGDRSAVTAGTRVVSDQLKILVTSEKGNSFLDHMIQMIEGAKRQKTPNEIALNILLSSLTIIFLIAVVSLKFFVDYTSISEQTTASHRLNIPILVSLLVCLIPTTISALLSAVGIAGMNRLISCNVVARSGRSVEAAGDVDLLILDKTGTITIGNRMATEFIPSPGISESEMATIAQLASLSDETPEGRSIVVLAKKQFTLRAESLEIQYSTFIPFSAITRMSGIDIADEKGQVIRQIRKGALDAIISHIESLNGKCSQETLNIAQGIAKKGGTPLIVSDNNKIIGVICLKDIIKGGIQERFKEMRTMGIRTLMITGDNPLTAAAIAAESGVDDFVAEATPEIKLNIIKEAQQQGHLVAMTGDGTNDAPALAQADVGVAMNTGTQASREAGNMVDLDSNPTKLINIVEIGKQLLMTRGALTTFSITNDIAKYFAIIPAIFGALYLIEGHSKGPLSLLNVMNLHSHKSAILSAVIFNALIIVALIPLALRGVNYKAQSANQLLLKNMLIYGLGGIITPFIFIKLIDLFLNILDII